MGDTAPTERKRRSLWPMGDTAPTERSDGRCGRWVILRRPSEATVAVDSTVLAPRETRGAAWLNQSPRRNEAKPALPERRVTVHSGDMGDTLPPRRGHALEGVSRGGRASSVCGPPARRRED